MIAPPPEHFDGPAGQPTPPPPKLTQAPTAARAGGTWAVIVGINDYPGHKSDLRASVNDADDVDAALAAYGVPTDRRLVLRDGQATAAVIDQSLQWLVDRAASDATVVFFYAGHVRKLSDGSEAIVAADGRLLVDRDVARRLRPLFARHVWIALAACYAGGFTEVLAPGRILTGAAGADDLAYENASYGRSYLVEFMVRRAMLEGRAAGSVEQSFTWAEETLRREHPDRVPVQHDRAEGALSLGAPPPPAPAEPSPPTSPPPTSTPPPSGDRDEDEDDCVITIGSLLACDD